MAMRMPLRNQRVRTVLIKMAGKIESFLGHPRRESRGRPLTNDQIGPVAKMVSLRRMISEVLVLRQRTDLGVKLGLRSERGCCKARARKRRIRDQNRFQKSKKTTA